MSEGRGTTREIEEGTTHIDAERAVSTYLDLPAISYAVACSRCRRIMTDRGVNDPGSVFRMATQCSDCLGARSETPKRVAVADSLVPGSFVLAPLTCSTLLAECILWPAMVDYSVEKDSSFCVLNSSGKPERYYVTFIMEGDRTYGGWFHESELRLFDASSKDVTVVAQKYIQACEKCRQAGESLPDRIRKLSPAARTAMKQPSGRSGGLQVPMEEVERELGAAADAFFSKEHTDRYCRPCKNGCFERKTGGRTFPSAAETVIFLTEKLDEIRFRRFYGRDEEEGSIAKTSSGDGRN